MHAKLLAGVAAGHPAGIYDDGATANRTDPEGFFGSLR